MKVCAAAAVLLAAALFLRLLFSRRFDSVRALQDYVRGFGIFGPLVLTLFQILQVVVPVLPGMFGCAAGAVLFGTMGGFVCNYIGICVGSLIAYELGRKYGIDLVLAMFSEKLYGKWSKRIAKSRSYSLFLFIATLLPLFPDDFFCYFSGLVKMERRKFFWIILLGKPWCILAYCIGFGLIK